MAYRTRRRRRNKNLQIFLFSAFVVGVILFFAYQNNQLSGAGLGNDIPQQVASASAPWTQTGYALRRKLKLGSTTGAITTLSFNHAELVDNNESRTDGGDIKIVAQSDDKAFDVPFIISGANTSNASIKFDTGEHPNADYFMYFDGKKQVVSTQTIDLAGTPTSTASVGDDEQPLISFIPIKYWNLRYNSGIDVEANLSIDASIWRNGDEVFYGHDGTTELKPITLSLNWTNPVKINVGQLPTGEQGLFIVVKHDGKYYRGPSVYTMISEPLFVAWTIDWDDKNNQDSFLSAINKTANQFKIPLTQFFNPRIYIDTSIPEYRRGQITNWLKSRQLVYHDEIALHLHMYFDLVKAAGVKPKTDPHWGTGVDGYDVLTSNYTTEEMSKILKWSIDEMASNGLPKPKGFRAGGWFANLDTLKALNDNGFIYDSSGREHYTFGAAETTGPWDLNHTSQPYHPSTTNQNGNTPLPVFDLWEMPNNGNDSYWFSADDLISRFYANYTPGETLDDPRIVTYLSHPDWFDVDQPKLNKLFLEIDKFSNDRDQGPVVYSTMSNALKEWQK